MSVVIPRSTWNPRYANGCQVIGTQEWLNASKELWLHHSTTNPPGPDATLEQDCQHMRDFEAIGQNRFGCGISYTWVVMPSGRIFQGHDLDRQGTHTYNRNNRARAICLAGNYAVNTLPQRMENAVARLLRELGATLDGGHRDVYATECPGDHAYNRIGSVNSLASSGAPIDDDDGADPGDGSESGELEMGSSLVRNPETGSIYVVTISTTTRSKWGVPDPATAAALESLMNTKVRDVPPAYAEWLADEPGTPPVDVDEQAVVDALIPVIVAAINDLPTEGLTVEETVEAVREALRRGTGA